MSIDGTHDLLALQEIGKIVAEARETMGAAVRPGVTTAELDRIGKGVLDRYGARSAPQKAYGFPGTTCISVNDAIAHGIPSDQVILKEGDLVNIDVSAELNDYWADTGASFAVGKVSTELQLLLSETRAALEDAMRVVRAGKPIKNIGRAVERRAQRCGFRIIENLCGHGVGRHIHEEPEIPNTYQSRNPLLLTEGLVFTIEPFLTTGATYAVQDPDGWTLRTSDGGWGAQFEHTLVVTRGEPMILTA